MVTLNAVESFFVVALSIYFANTVNTQQIFQTLFNQTGVIGHYKLISILYIKISSQFGH